jgi:hypothetical protein
VNVNVFAASWDREMNLESSLDSLKSFFSALKHMRMQMSVFPVSDVQILKKKLFPGFTEC